MGGEANTVNPAFTGAGSAGERAGGAFPRSARACQPARLAGGQNEATGGVPRGGSARGFAPRSSAKRAMGTPVGKSAWGCDRWGTSSFSRRRNLSSGNGPGRQMPGPQVTKTPKTDKREAAPPDLPVSGRQRAGSLRVRTGSRNGRPEIAAGRAMGRHRGCPARRGAMVGSRPSRPAPIAPCAVQG